MVQWFSQILICLSGILDNVGSVLSIWELINDSFSFDSSTGWWILARDDSEDGEVSFGGINSVRVE